MSEKHTETEIRDAAYPRMLDLLKRINALPCEYPPNSKNDWDCGTFLDFDLSSAVADLLTAIKHPEEGTAKRVLWGEKDA